ncbi:hypothetical protein TVAG_103960 [Trichomonas vaginalis G3]|uniref:Uncharacterized protein n=1 Tax=Trichomonas vaginalis (strain ATCC PRA-98 / G3) TaxID=412133 RepID=A2FN35_TRIV3|nr:hypothetical protein TVAGG3_0044000 [Trichomonas vaginalis G3]EAX93677.1 hypothetical protein TVAG_103960 [Trichomonas vaginalis G3]KAI5540902.1 hypothetical protein TVAGG3_0044000 [Trichomonas vaginalis G3]|eukprot:XP_001306607.1 hypothetical protein [Trichomonas vaginalis G3]
MFGGNITLFNDLHPENRELDNVRRLSQFEKSALVNDDLAKTQLPMFSMRLQLSNRSVLMFWRHGKKELSSALLPPRMLTTLRLITTSPETVLGTRRMILNSSESYSIPVEGSS